MKNAIASLLLLAAVAHADTFTVRIKTDHGNLPVGEITRTNGKVTWKSVRVPAIEKLTDQFIADWNALQRPPSVTVKETIASDTGMHPSFDVHTATFTPKDRLYLPAVIREFCEKRGFDPLGMSSVKFIEFDRSAESPPGAHDASSTHSNFRKGTGKDLYDSGDYTSFFIKAPLRKANMGKPDMVLRTSVKDPKLAVAQNWDDGTIFIAQMKVFKDGRVEVTAERADKQFETSFGGLDRDVEVSLITDAKDWKSVKIKKSSPLQLEAYIVGVLEQHLWYDVSPVIDPIVFK